VIKLHRSKYQLLLVSSILLMFSILISGQEIINKKIEYTLQKSLLKTATSEFVSEIIEIPIINPEPFIAIGFNVKLTSEISNTQFYIRVSKDDNTWDDWQLIVNDDDVEKIGDNYFASLSFFEKENKYIQFRTNAYSDLENLTFNFISPGKTSKSKIESRIQQSQLNKTLEGIERPAFVSRKDWGSPQDEHVSSRSLTPVTHLIIHHSAAHTVATDYAAVVRTYWNWHVNGNGWDDIGYNWLVDPNGVLYKGRAWKSETQENVLGAHNSSKNSGTTGICFIGNYVSSIPSDAGLDKIASIAAFLSDKYGINPTGKSYHAAIEKENDNITGHGQSGGGTACPGTQVINRMQIIRELTSSKILDITASPEVVLTYPNESVDSAYHSKNIFVKFSHPMNQTSVESALSITPNVFGTLSWNSNGDIIYFTPSPTFTKQTNYTLTISKSALSNWDVPLSNDIELNFVTKTHDNLSLVSNYPVNNEIGIDLNVAVTLEFDGSLNQTSLGGNVIFLDTDGNQVPIRVDAGGYSDGIIKFTPQALLNENSLYSVLLKEGISTTDGYTFGKMNTIYFTTKSITSVDDFNSPTTFNLISAYPNPFNPSTNIEYQLKSKTHVSIKVYDIIGNLITTLVNQEMNAGIHHLTFDAANLPSGIYFSQIVTSRETKTIKLLLTK
jgi:N-acetylmuramoyl-L-alanine amidase-like protein/type IX secretion system substrate protein/Big-like domain-containing protein